MTWFQKAKHDAHQFFSKHLNDPNLFRKIDNTVGRIAKFIGNTADTFDVPEVSRLTNHIANKVHTVRNNLELAERMPISDLRKEQHYA